MELIERLAALEEIRALKARYFRTVDHKDWAGLGQVFAEDAEFDISDDVPGAVVTGREKILALVSGPLAHAVSVHHGHCPEIAVSSATEASGVWAMEDLIHWSSPADAPVRALHGFGHYFERYVRSEGRWWIQSLKLKRLRVETSPWDDGRA